MVGAIGNFLSGATTAFAFDDRLCTIDGGSNDRTVHYIARELWSYYDDLIDHHAALSREDWDCVQRLLLVLQSNADIHLERRFAWTQRQIVALAVMFVCAIIAFSLGVDWRLLFITLPLGLVSLGLWVWRTRAELTEVSKLSRLQPFSSVSELRAVHRLAPEFQKQRYPAIMASRLIRLPLASAAMALPFIGVWFVFSPVVIACQALPEVKRTTRVALK